MPDTYIPGEFPEGSFFIPLSPMSSRGRVRMANGRMFRDKDTDNHLAAMAQIVSKYMQKFELSTFRTEVFYTELTVFKKTPKKRDKKWCLVGDTDNYEKTLKDGLRGSFYADDKQVRKSYSEVEYGDEPGYLVNWFVIGHIDDKP